MVGYPEGPYGAEPGSVIENACFRGLLAPNRVAEPTDAALEVIRLSDFHAPGDATSKPELLLLNTAAVWCSACRIEHETLKERATEFGARGLTIVSALFQAQDRSPASISDFATWTRVFETNFPMLLDPDYTFGRYASADTAPLNLLVDARDMRILEKYIGDQAELLWSYVDARLARD